MVINGKTVAVTFEDRNFSYLPTVVGKESARVIYGGSTYYKAVFDDGAVCYAEADFPN